jgi:hypothetical protein
MNGLTLELGHTSPDMLWRPFQAHSRLEDAQAYFNIYPPKGEED